MTITYTWIINSLEVEKERIYYVLSGSEDPNNPDAMIQVEDGEPLHNIILSVDWTLRGTDSENLSIFAEESGKNRIRAPTRESFSAFEEVQEQQLTSWLEESFISKRYVAHRYKPTNTPICITEDKLQFVKNRISAKINDIKAPKILNMSPPWLSGSV